MVDNGLEAIGQQPTDSAVDTIGAHDQISVGELIQRVDLSLELEAHTRSGGLLLECRQQRVTAHAAETVPGRNDRLAAVMYGDVVPANQAVRDRRERFAVRLGNPSHRRVRKHHAETERVAGTVAFDDTDVVLGGRPLHQESEIKTSRPAADADDPQAARHAFVASSKTPPATISR